MESDSRNQSVLNEGIYGAVWGFGAESGSFLCECERSSCSEEVVMTPSAYVLLRDRGEIVIAPGHGQAIS